MRCANCNTQLTPDERFCGECGHPVKAADVSLLVTEPERCPRCGAKAEADERFCSSCGYDLSSEPAEPVREAPPATNIAVEAVCSQCRAPLEANKKFCGSCGKPVAPKPVRPRTQACPSCGTPADPGERFCGKCGSPLGVVQPARKSHGLGLTIGGILALLVVGVSVTYLVAGRISNTSTVQQPPLLTPKTSSIEGQSPAHSARSPGDQASIPTIPSKRSPDLRTLTGHKGEVHSVAFSPDGKRLASGSFDKSVIVWDVQTGASVRTLTGLSGIVSSVAFSPDGREVASGSGNSRVSARVHLWDVQTGAMLQDLTGHGNNVVNSLVFSPDGKILASGSGDTTVKLWDTETGSLLHTLKMPGGIVNGAVFSPDGRILASGSNDNHPSTGLKLWDVKTGTLLQMPTFSASHVGALAFSPDSKMIATGHYQEVKLWDAQTGRLKSTLPGYSGYTRSVAFSPDGKTLATGSDDGTVRLWDTQSGELKRTRDSRVFIFPLDLDMETGQLKRTHIGHNGSVNSVAFSSDGRLLASGSQDQTVKLWDVQTWLTPAAHPVVAGGEEHQQERNKESNCLKLAGEGKLKKLRREHNDIIHGRIRLDSNATQVRLREIDDEVASLITLGLVYRCAK